MRSGLVGVVLLGAALVAGAAGAAPTRSSTIQVSAAGVVFVVNPDSNSVGRLEFDAMHAGTLTHEAAVGTYPRTLALGATHVFTADQTSDTVSRLDQADLGQRKQVALGFGCSPYGVAATPAGDRIVVSCQGTSEVVILDAELVTVARVRLAWPVARAIAISSDGTKAYVTHFLTAEPVDDAHVSVVDLANNSVLSEFAVPPDLTTCEGQNSGQGVLNLVSAIALIPDNPAEPEVAGQVWIGGTQQNNVSKGLFKRSDVFKKRSGADMFPFTYAPFPEGGGLRNIYRASFHDVTRFGIYKLAASDGRVIGKIDVDEANNATDIQFSPDGRAAYVVDHMFNSYHIFNTVKGQRLEDVTTLFAGPSQFGPGGAEDSEPCQPEPLTLVVSERPFRLAPQAQISVIDGIDPADMNGAPVRTGVDFDAAHYIATGESRLRPGGVPDGIGTTPMGVALSPDGQTVYVANYLARNVVPAAAAAPLDGGGKPANFRCSNNIAATCGTTNDCQGSTGFCNHPGGAPCTTDADCGSTPPCVQTADCVPLMLGQPVSTIGILGPDPVHPGILDGKILSNTAARDGSVPNGVGLGEAAPPFNAPRLVCAHDPVKACENAVGCSFCANDPSLSCAKNGDCAGARCVLEAATFCSNDPTRRCRSDTDCPGAVCESHDSSFCSNNPVLTCDEDGDCPGGTCREASCSLATNPPGEVVSVSHDASYVTCTACHADFGGQDGRTWDFSQFGASLRNTMELRGRAGFAPGTCAGGPRDGAECFFDAACGDGFFCQADDANIPPNIQGPDRTRFFNPMLTVHWNGDRDEVEDFEHTYRQLLGAGDCDTIEDRIDTCMGALIQRSRRSSSDPADVDTDLGRPNRNIPGPLTGKIVGIRLTHMADFVYSLTDFPKNPNQPTEASERGRRIFNDPLTQCASCHRGGPGPGREFFTDKAPNSSFDPAAPARSDANNPFIRHDVGTANVFDLENPFAIASQNQTFQNARIPIPGNRGVLGDYVTPVLTDLWNTAPYLHDGSAHTLLDVIRPCDTAVDDCLTAGRGRNLRIGGVEQHGATSFLTPQQLEDLVAFQKTLSTATVVGTNLRVLSVGTLDLGTATLQFGKPRRRGPGRRGAFRVSGRLGAVPGGLDPRASGIVLTLAVPDGEAMAIFTRSLEVKGGGKRFRARSTDGGLVTLALRRTAGGDYRLRARGKRLDLSALDTGNRDLTVAVEIGGTSFVRNRNLKGKRRVFKLPRG